MNEGRGGKKEEKKSGVMRRREGPWVHNPLTDSFVE